MGLRVEVNNINLITILINQYVRLKNRGKVNKLSKNKDNTVPVLDFTLHMCTALHQVLC